MFKKFKRLFAIAMLATALTVLNCSFVAFAEEGLGGLTDTFDSELEDDTLTKESGGLETGGNELGKGGGGGGDTTENNADSAVVVDTGDAVQDILSGSRYQGAMSSIVKLTNFVDRYFIIIISVVAFFIISAALLKNACAGAYCANQKFWNKVDEAHKKAEAYSLSTLKDYFGQRQFMQTTPTGIRDFFLGLVPNIKAFTDFEDGDVEPKAYFMRSIPQMIACVIIGIFIYNGYYRDTASAVGSFGAESFERIMTNADPVALADRLYNTIGKPATSFDNSKTPKSRLGKSIADQTYSAIITQYSDIDGATVKNQIMSEIVTQTNLILNAADATGEGKSETGTNYLETTGNTTTGAKYNFSTSVKLAIDASQYGGADKAHWDEHTNESYLDYVWSLEGGTLQLVDWSQKYHDNQANALKYVCVHVTFKPNTENMITADGTVTMTVKEGASKEEITKALGDIVSVTLSTKDKYSYLDVNYKTGTYKKDGDTHNGKSVQISASSGDKTELTSAIKWKDGK